MKYLTQMNWWVISHPLELSRISQESQIIYHICERSIHQIIPNIPLICGSFFLGLITLFRCVILCLFDVFSPTFCRGSLRGMWCCWTIETHFGNEVEITKITKWYHKNQKRAKVKTQSYLDQKRCNWSWPFVFFTCAFWIRFVQTCAWEFSWIWRRKKYSTYSHYSCTQNTFFCPKNDIFALEMVFRTQNWHILAKYRPHRKTTYLSFSNLLAPQVL